MSTIQPPPAAPPVITTAGPAPAPVVVVNNATVELLQLPPGNQLSAQVAASTTPGQTEIDTALGRFSVETPLNLKSGQTLLLQVPPKAVSGPALTFHVLEIAGKSAPGIHSLQSASSDATGLAGNPTGNSTSITANQTSQAPPGPTVLTLSVGSTVGATLLSATPVFTVAPDGSFTVVQGTNPASGGLNQQGIANPSTDGAPTQSANTAIPAASVPNSTGQTLGQASGNSHMFSVGPQQSSAIPGPHAGSIGHHVAGSQLTINIQSLNPPSAGVPSVVTSGGPASPFMPGMNLTGYVSGATALGHTIVHTPGATVSINTAQSLPPGTEITFRVETTPQPPQDPKTLPPTLHREGMLASQTWPSLEESLRVLHEASPTTASQISNHVIPKLNVQFTATALFFLSALRSGDVRSWIGDNAAKILEKARPDAMKRLGDDFRAMGAIDEDASGPSRATDWRGTLVPFQTQDGLEQIRLYTKQLHDEDDNEDQRVTGNRFLIDVTLSSMGRLQLDGMIEKMEKRLDLIIRTSHPLPPMVRNDMMELFTRSNEIVGMHGGMSFQAAPNGFIEMESQSRNPDSGLGIVV